VKGTFLKKDGQTHLLLFFTGWGMDPHPFRVLDARAYDIFVCYAYKRPWKLPSVLKQYQKVTVLAWSLGVAVALRLSPNIKASRWIFLNGTGALVHPRFGISPRVFSLTLDSLKQYGSKTLQNFYQNMFSGEKQAFFELFLRHRPQRDLAEVIAELEEASSLKQEDLLIPHQTTVLAGQKDRIIPIQKQLNFWNTKGVRLKVLPWGHFPFYRFVYLDDLLETPL